MPKWKLSYDLEREGHRGLKSMENIDFINKNCHPDQQKTLTVFLHTTATFFITSLHILYINATY